jgi:hypothetical protein
MYNHIRSHFGSIQAFGVHFVAYSMPTKAELESFFEKFKKPGDTTSSQGSGSQMTDMPPPAFTGSMHHVDVPFSPPETPSPKRSRLGSKCFEPVADCGTSDGSTIAFDRRIEGLEALARALNKQPSELVAAMGSDPAASLLLGNVSEAELYQLQHHSWKPMAEKPPFGIQNLTRHSHTHHTPLYRRTGHILAHRCPASCTGSSAGFLAGFRVAPPSAVHFDQIPTARTGPVCVCDGLVLVGW